VRQLRYGVSPLRGASEYVFSKLPRDRQIIAAEIGVWEGQHALTWLIPSKWNQVIRFGEVVLVDPIKTSVQLESISAVTENFPVAKFLNMTSVEASTKFADEYFDFIYIDAVHYYADVAADLAAWNGKVKAGGFIAGHDYDVDPNFDVNRAVDEFARSKNAEVIKLHTEFCMRRTW
jgi:hypothetical protein